MKVNLSSSFFLFLLIIKKVNKEWAVGRFVFRQHQQFSVASKFLFCFIVVCILNSIFLVCSFFCFGRHHSHMFRGTFLKSFYFCFVFSWLLWSFRSSYTYLFLREFLTYCSFHRKNGFFLEKRLFFYIQ